MSNWKDTVAKYSREAGKMAHADGGNLYQTSQFIGQNKAEYVGQRQYADGGPNAGGAVYSKLSDVQKFYTVVITNTSTAATTNAVVFGANQYPADAQPAGVTATVTIAESSHAQVRAESQYSPFWVNGCRYFTATTNQLTTQIWSLQRRESSGQVVQNPIRPLAYKTANQNQSNQVDMDTLTFGVDGATQLVVPVVASETVQIILQIGGRFSPTEIVDGKSPLLVANLTPLSTGVTPIIIQK